MEEGRKRGSPHSLAGFGCGLVVFLGLMVIPFPYLVLIAGGAAVFCVLAFKRRERARFLGMIGVILAGLGLAALVKLSGSIG